MKIVMTKILCMSTRVVLERSSLLARVLLGVGICCALLLSMPQGAWADSCAEASCGPGSCNDWTVEDKACSVERKAKEGVLANVETLRDERKARLQTERGVLTGLTNELTALNKELTAFEARVQAIDEEKDQIEEDYGSQDADQLRQDRDDAIQASKDAGVKAYELAKTIKGGVIELEHKLDQAECIQGYASMACAQDPQPLFGEIMVQCGVWDVCVDCEGI